jgi:hypothetical protein
MRWDCKKQGCFNLKCRPKIEVFADCFPGRINFGDVDGIVEINSKGLILEWKCFSDNIPIGQEIMYKRLSESGNLSTIGVFGNAESMNVKRYCWFRNGIWEGWEGATLEDVKGQMMEWCKFVRRE